MVEGENLTGYKFILWENCQSSELFFGLNKPRDKSDWVIGITNAVLALLASVMNFLIIASIVKRKKLRTMSNLILAFLAVSDLITGLTSIPFFAYAHMTTVNISCFFLLLYCSLTFLLCNWTTFGLIFIAADRYVAIFRPFNYLQWATTRGFFLAAALALTYSFGIGFGAHFTKEKILFTHSFPILVTFMLVVSVCVHVKSFRLSKSIRVRDSCSMKTHAQATRDRRISSTVFAILCVMVTCYTPYVVTSLLTATVITDPTIGLISLKASLFLVMANSAINPFIYCWKMSAIRSAVLSFGPSCVAVSADGTSESTATIAADRNDRKIS